MPALALDPAATTRTIGARDGHPIPLRLFHPAKGRSAGTYLHLHGGGWMYGSADENDPRLRRLADNTGLDVVSVDYRLAPEHPFPLGPNDCEDAALALATGGIAGVSRGFLAIGGESAGAHLAVLTLLRLRDDHGLTPFSAANLVAGCFDLSLTPSVRNFGPERLVLNSNDVLQFVRRFLPESFDRTNPEVSPLYADLTGLPPALFTCGTRDLLLDDTLFMSARWFAAGNGTNLSLYNGGAHVFQMWPGDVGDTSLGEMEGCLRSFMHRAG
ncbi:alpha/beta hydrolase [Aurantimonas sp. MSK8Z-1]|nr:alpha/beta hydrolase [Aurantimonas sp. CSK15Z-1]MCW4116175.1 alpha/beta hydrolase [Aurantimonas sp. MSK8Z-1]